MSAPRLPLRGTNSCRLQMGVMTRHIRVNLTTMIAGSLPGGLRPPGSHPEAPSARPPARLVGRFGFGAQL
eukprot:15445715-Alexandrium_andersonii.AAC.1